MRLRFLMGLVLVACNSEPKCGGFLSSKGETESTFTAQSCPDNVVYSVKCVAKPDGSGQTCTCTSTGGTKTGPTGITFNASDPLPSVEPNADRALAVVNPACGWKIHR